MVARTQPQTQPQSFAEKSLDLARRQREAHGGICWKTQAVRFSADGTRITAIDYRVESLSTEDGWHDVHYDAIRDHATCNCRSGGFRRACCHSGIGFTFGRSAAQAWARQSDAERAYDAQRDAAHEDNAHCLGY